MGWPGRAQRTTLPLKLDGEASKLKEHTMHAHQKSSDPVATIGLDIGKNTFHLVGLDKRGEIVLRIKISRNQLVRRLVNLATCLVGLEAGSGSHHIARQIQALGHDVRTNGLPGATARLGANLALRGLSGSVGCTRIPILARSINAPLQRSDTLTQLSRSPAQHSALRRTAGPYILAHTCRARTCSKLRQILAGNRTSKYPSGISRDELRLAAAP